MLLEDWLQSSAPSDLYSHFSRLSPRKLNLLTAAFLRRVWDQLPSHHTRTAVEATEQFADGRVTADELARLRSTDLLESGEALWLDPDNSDREESLIGRGWHCCDWCDRWDRDYECRATASGKGLDGVSAGVRNPAWIAVQAAFFARDLVAWAAEPHHREQRTRDEAVSQFALFSEVIGGGHPVDPRWNVWRTSTVRLVARSIHRDGTFDLLPILADALQDAGCDDEPVLSHCRATDRTHARGCWVLDLAMGVP
jgi:hypothetical protein